MKIQATEIKNISFLGRKRINQKDDLFKAFLRERVEGKAICEIVYDARKIYQNVNLDFESQTFLVVDIFVLGQVTRLTLLKNSDQLSQHVVLDDVPDGAIPRLRLKITSEDKDSNGIILAATANLLPFKSPISDEQSEAGKSNKRILNFEHSDDLEGCLIKVTWTLNADLLIKVDRSFYRQYETNSGLLRLTLYPDMIRSVAVNLLSRVDELRDLDENCTAFGWLKFIEDKLEIPLLGEDSIYDPQDPETLPDRAESIVERFMAKQWNAGKTLLEEVINGN